MSNKHPLFYCISTRMIVVRFALPKNVYKNYPMLGRIPKLKLLNIKPQVLLVTTPHYIMEACKTINYPFPQYILVWAGAATQFYSSCPELVSVEAR